MLIVEAFQTRLPAGRVVVEPPVDDWEVVEFDVAQLVVGQSVEQVGEKPVVDLDVVVSGFE